MAQGLQDEPVDNQDGKERRIFVSAYTLSNLAAYHTYLKEYAAKFRGDALAKFAGKMKATRRVLHVKKHFKKS